MKITTTFVPMLLFTLAACESPEDRLARLIDEAKACEAGDTCVLAGDSDCTCGVPVNESRAAEVDDAAKDIQCCTLLGSCVQVECAAFQDVRCEDGECIGD